MQAERPTLGVSDANAELEAEVQHEMDAQQLQQTASAAAGGTPNAGGGDAATVEADAGVQHKNIPITKLTRVLLQRLEQDEDYAMTASGRRTRGSGAAVRGVQETFTLRDLRAKGIVRKVIVSRLPTRVARDLEERLVYVVVRE